MTLLTANRLTSNSYTTHETSFFMCTCKYSCHCIYVFAYVQGIGIHGYTVSG